MREAEKDIPCPERGWWWGWYRLYIENAACLMECKGRERTMQPHNMKVSPPPPSFSKNGQVGRKVVGKVVGVWEKQQRCRVYRMSTGNEGQVGKWGVEEGVGKLHVEVPVQSMVVILDSRREYNRSLTGRRTAGRQGQCGCE